jgi:hypothetical protein
MQEHKYIDPVSDLAARVNRIENSLNDIIKTHFELRTEFAGIKVDLDYIRKSQDKVGQGVARIFWAFVLSGVGTVSAFILQGGLVLAQ